MKFTDTPTTTLDELLISTRGNKSHAATKIGITRTTLRNYIAKKDKVLLVQIDGKLVPFVADRRQGAHKKATPKSELVFMWSDEHKEDRWHIRSGDYYYGPYDTKGEAEFMLERN